MSENIAPWADADSEEREQFHELYRKFLPKVKKCAADILRCSAFQFGDIAGSAEDIVQEVFICAWKKRNEFFACEAQQQWLMTTLRNKVMERRRADRRWKKGQEALALQSEEYMDELPPKLTFAGLLSEENLELFTAIYLDGYTYQEVGSATGKKKSAVAMRVSRAKQEVIKKFEKFEN